MHTYIHIHAYIRIHLHEQKLPQEDEVAEEQFLKDVVVYDTYVHIHIHIYIHTYIHTYMSRSCHRRTKWLRSSS